MIRYKDNDHSFNKYLKKYRYKRIDIKKQYYEIFYFDSFEVKEIKAQLNNGEYEVFPYKFYNVGGYSGLCF